MSKDMHRFGRRYFDKTEMELPHGMEGVVIYPGYTTEISFKKMSGKIVLTLNVNPVSKVLGTGNA